MTPQQEAAARALVKRVEEERGVTWGRSGLGLWRTEHTPSAAVCDVLAPLLAALDEARRERDEARRGVDAIEERRQRWSAEVQRVHAEMHEMRKERDEARQALCSLLSGHLSPSDAVRQSAVSAAVETRRGWGM